jgi:nucleoside 2-deoxyribosyltransferase
MTERTNLYLIGSLRNPDIPLLGNALRQLGFDVFDDWFAAGEIADTAWRVYEQERGHTFAEALQGRAARHVFSFDRHHLLEADVGVLVMPAGKSGHIEAGFLAGQGKPVYVLLPEEPDRLDVMYAFFAGVFCDKEELMQELKGLLR